MLAHATAYNAPAAPEAMRVIAGALGTDDAAKGLYDLAHRLGATLDLKTLGMTRDGIETAADIAMANPYCNPRTLDREAIRDLLTRACAGEPPRA